MTIYCGCGAEYKRLGICAWMHRKPPQHIECNAMVIACRVVGAAVVALGLWVLLS